MAVTAPTAALRADVTHLASIYRPSASPGEGEAAEWIGERLRELGLDARVEEERAHGTYWWPIGLLNALSALGRVPALIAIAALWDDLDHRRRWFRRVLPKRPTYNVWAMAGDLTAERTVVAVAHHDAAHGGLVFDETAVRLLKEKRPDLHARIKSWPPTMRLVLLGPILHALGLHKAGRVANALTIASMVDIGVRRAVPGANDNLTASAAVLELARRLKADPVRGVKVLLLSTGSEESLSEGMQAFMTRHAHELPPATTEVIGLECLGSGKVTVAEGEGFLTRHDYDDELKDLAMDCAARLGIDAQRGLVNAFASDTQIALHFGYRAMLLGALDELKLPSNYHKPTDTAENVDYRSLKDCVDVLEAMVRSRAAA